MSWLDKYLFHKTALGQSFLKRIISSAQIILLRTVCLSQLRTFRDGLIVIPFKIPTSELRRSD